MLDVPTSMHTRPARGTYEPGMTENAPCERGETVNIRFQTWYLTQCPNYSHVRHGARRSGGTVS